MEPRLDHSDPLTPAGVCRGLLGALDASEGRRRRRARNTTADAIGLQMKRELLEAVVREDPPSGSFEQWLLTRCLAEGPSDGALRAMALSIWEDWRLAMSASEFRAWLMDGAPSDDRPTLEDA
jgi:hypothetical protein